jgi:hypothetical protein
MIRVRIAKIYKPLIDNFETHTNNFLGSYPKKILNLGSGSVVFVRIEFKFEKVGKEFSLYKEKNKLSNSSLVNSILAYAYSKKSDN